MRTTMSEMKCTQGKKSMKSFKKPKYQKKKLKIKNANYHETHLNPISQNQ